MAVLEARERVTQHVHNFGEKRQRRLQLASFLGKSIIAASRIGSLIAWGNTENEVSSIPYSGPPTESIGIVVRGLGSIGQGGKDAAIRMGGTSLGNQPWFAFDYNNLSGINIQTHVEQLQNRKDNPDSSFNEMNVVTLSMGIVLALEVARRTNTPIRTLIAIDPATHINDA